VYHILQELDQLYVVASWDELEQLYVVASCWIPRTLYIEHSELTSWQAIYTFTMGAIPSRPIGIVNHGGALQIYPLYNPHRYVG